MISLRKIVLANATEFNIIRAIDSSIPAASKKSFTITFEDYTLEEIKVAFMSPFDINVIKLYDGDGELVRVISDYDLYDIQLKHLNSTEQIIVNLIEGDKLEKKVAILQNKISNIDEPIEEDMNMMTLSELKDYKKSLLQSDCRKIIYTGAHVTTSAYGLQHFSYTEDDQRNIESLFNLALVTGLEEPYHADGETCTLYSAADIIKIYVTLQKHRLYHTALINAYNRYIENISDIDILKGLSYPSSYEKFPQNYKDSVNAAVTQCNYVITALVSSKDV